MHAVILREKCGRDCVTVAGLLFVVSLCVVFGLVCVHVFMSLFVCSHVYMCVVLCGHVCAWVWLFGWRLFVLSSFPTQPPGVLLVVRFSWLAFWVTVLLQVFGSGYAGFLALGFSLPAWLRVFACTRLGTGEHLVVTIVLLCSLVSTMVYCFSACVFGCQCGWQVLLCCFLFHMVTGCVVFVVSVFFLGACTFFVGVFANVSRAP